MANLIQIIEKKNIAIAEWFDRDMESDNFELAYEIQCLFNEYEFLTGTSGDAAMDSFGFPNDLR